MRYEKITLNHFFLSEFITEFALQDPKQLAITRFQKWERLPCPPKTAAIFLIPYFTGYADGANLSCAAYARDPRLYFAGLKRRAKKAFGALLLGGEMEPSSIDTLHAALISGLGILGETGLLIHPTYGSYVRIGVFYFDAEETHPVFSPLAVRTHEIKSCPGCGRCGDACPFERCVAELNRKKTLTPEEEEILARDTCVWGCDLCQRACPLNRNAAHTPIPFFSRQLISRLDPALLRELLRTGEFKKRIYARTGAEALLRNLRLTSRQAKERGPDL